VLLTLLLLCLLTLCAVLVARALLFHPPRTQAVAPCTATINAEEAAQALSALVQCKTVSHPDAVYDDEAEFEKMVNLLPTLFPRVHQACVVERVGGRSLLYRWPGPSAEAPLVLTAHYDVVPADPAEWDFDPFCGEISEGVIHGRGTLDTKCTLSAILTSAETLLAQGYAPARDVYFSFAGNEEVMGSGAAALVDTLEKRGIRPLCVVDEGGAIVENVFPGVATPCALIGVAEKGSVNYRLSVRAKGGHSSAPLAQTPVDILAQACVRIRQKPFPFRVTRPARMLVNGLARHSGFAFRLLFANLWLFSPLLNLIAKKSGGELNALFRTTTAFTVFRAGEAVNVLPSSAEMLINARLLPGDTAESILSELRAKVADARVEVSLLRGLPPSACSDTNGPGYAAITKTIGEVYPGVLVSPYLMIACSDARHYERICEHVYRFSGMSLSSAERRMIHGANEQIPVAKQADTAKFFLRLILNTTNA